MSELIDRTPQVLTEVWKKIPKGFPEMIAETTLEGLQVGARRLGG